MVGHAICNILVIDAHMGYGKPAIRTFRCGEYTSLIPKWSFWEGKWANHAVFQCIEFESILTYFLTDAPGYCAGIMVSNLPAIQQLYVPKNNHVVLLPIVRTVTV